MDVAFGISHVGVFPELLESLAGTGQFADECAQPRIVGAVGGQCPQAADGQSGRVVPVGIHLLGRGIEEPPTQEAASRTTALDHKFALKMGVTMLITTLPVASASSVLPKTTARLPAPMAVGLPPA